MKILITDKIHEDGLNLLNESNINFDFLDNTHNLINAAKDYSGIISMLSDKIDSNFLNLNTHLKVISNYAVGYNNIDLETATNKNIIIGNTPDVLTDATADLTMALILATTRNLRAAIENVNSGKWKKWEPLGFLGMGLKGKKLGIIGLGRIGKAVAKRANLGFDMEILYHHTGISKSSSLSHDNYTQVSFEQLLIKSDIISLHCPLNEQTQNLFNNQSISKMKKGAYFINTARGSMHDEQSLYNALVSKKLNGVGLDVTNPEPMKPTSNLLSHPNAFIVPHIGSATHTARRDMSIICAKNIILGLQGKRSQYSLN